MVDWTEKYRPRDLDDVVGNSGAVRQLREWAASWRDGVPKKKKAAILMGEPGIGKTSSAHALAREMEWQVLEMNASDTRNYDAVQRVATRGALGDTFSDSGEFLSSDEGQRKLIILDEADNLFGREDRGGIRAMSWLVNNTRQPIVLIVNDFYDLKRRSSAIARDVLQIKFQKPRPASIAKLLRGIARAEGIDVSPEALRAISRRVSGDVRAAVNDLQSLVEGREKVSERDVIALGTRDHRKSIFAGLGVIFHTRKCAKAREALMELEEKPDFIILWIDENIPLAYSDPADRARAYDALSKADRFLGRVHRRQNFGLWSYANDMMGAGVALSKRRDYRGFTKYRFPSWLSQMSRTKGIRGVRDSFGAKLAAMTHTSRSQALQDQLPYFRALYKNNKAFRLRMTDRMSLEEEEVAFLLQNKVDSHPVKHVFDDLRKLKKAGKEPAKPKKPEPVEEKPPEEDEGEEEAPQTKLFDF